MDKRLIENLSLNVLYQILTIFVPFITAPYLGRVLSVQQIGTYTFVLSIVSYFTHFSVLGLLNYGSREIAKVRNNDEERKKTFNEIYMMQLFSAVPSLIIYVSYVLIIHTEYSYISRIMILWVASCIFDVGWFFTGMEKFRVIVARNVVIKTLNIILILSLVKNETDFNRYVYIMAGCQFLFQFLLIAMPSKELSFKHIHISNVLSRFKPNLLLFIPILALSIYQIMDKIMIGVLSTKSELAYYEYAEKIIQIPLLVFGSIGVVMLSRCSSLQTSNSNKSMDMILYSMDFSLVFGLFASFGLAAISKELITIYYGIKFINSCNVMNCLIPIILLCGWTNVLRMQYVIPLGKDYIYIRAAIFGALVNFVLNSILIPLYSSYGAAIATVAAQITVATVFTLSVKNDLPLLSYLKRNYPFLLVAILMFLGIKACQFFHTISIFGLVADVLVGMILAVLLLIVLTMCFKKDHLLTLLFEQISNKFSQ